MVHKNVQMAWREKLALVLLILLACAVFLFYLVGIQAILCPKTRALSQGQLDGRKNVVSMYGNYYSIGDILKDHIDEKGYLNQQAFVDTVQGRDVSAMFYRQDDWNGVCPRLPRPSNDWDSIVRVVPQDAQKTWNFHRAVGSSKNYFKMVKGMLKGPMARDIDYLKKLLVDDPIRTYLIVAYGKVYDVSAYMDLVTSVDFLGPNIKSIFQTVGKEVRDSTGLFEQIKKLEGAKKLGDYMNCMDNLFYVGIVDNRKSYTCLLTNQILFVSSILLMCIIGVKFLAALQFQSGNDPEPQDRHVIVTIPCFNEGADALRTAITSIVSSIYADQRILLFIIVDGMVVGSGNDRPTLNIILDLLGVEDGRAAPDVAYHAIATGSQQLNFGRVYSGHIDLSCKKLPFICVAKVGAPGESYRPGNRGKRDSQMVLMQYLSRVYTGAPMNPLELEIYSNFTFLGLDPKWYEFVLCVDGDTEILPGALSSLVAEMAQDKLIAGICGETQLRNENQSWVTMIQVYEYFISHHLSKSFESLFNTVTCLPGCFSMFRIYSSVDMKPVLALPALIDLYGQRTVDTLHLKNLLVLGEDRYLTTLMLKLFPHFKLKFTSRAKAKTSAPTSWQVLLSQRRRWINSTVHNLLELLLVKDMCGCFIFSMRFIVIFDLCTTMLSPAGFLYIIWMIYSLATDENDQIPLISLLMIAAIYGLQVVLFILKREWQHIGWMVLVLEINPVYFSHASVPVFSPAILVLAL